MLLRLSKNSVKAQNFSKILTVRLMNIRRNKLTLVYLTVLVLAGCQTINTEHNWPENMPDRKLFVDSFLAKQGNVTVTKRRIEEHLIWIKRFYQGTIIYPNGWNRATLRFAATVNDIAAREDVERRMYELGIKISNEWAQDNRVRKIDNNAIAVWGEALRTAAKRSEQQQFIGKVELDVDALLSGKIKSKDINYERYYPEDDYDNF